MSEKQNKKRNDSIVSMEGAGMVEVNMETLHIQKIKKIIHAFPLEKNHEDYDRHLVQQYKHFVLNIAMYIRSIDFTNQLECANCYEFL